MLFLSVGMTGFEPATTRPPDDYCKSHYNLDYQCNAYLPFLNGLIHGLNRINRDVLHVITTAKIIIIRVIVNIIITSFTQNLTTHPIANMQKNVRVYPIGQTLTSVCYAAVFVFFFSIHFFHIRGALKLSNDCSMVIEESFLDGEL